MYRTFAAVLVLLLRIAAASTAFPEAPRTKIGLNKRSSLTQLDGSVNIANLRFHLASSTAKIRHGFADYEKNTGSKHPLAAKSMANKRAAGTVPLTDYNAQMWYGGISIGTQVKISQASRISFPIHIFC
jgi:cathepsin D